MHDQIEERPRPSISRRRKSRTPVTNTTPLKDGSPLGQLTDAELLKELGRRRLRQGKANLEAIESKGDFPPGEGTPERVYVAELAKDDVRKTFVAALAALEEELATLGDRVRCCRSSTSGAASLVDHPHPTRRDVPS